MSRNNKRLRKQSKTNNENNSIYSVESVDTVELLTKKVDLKKIDNNNIEHDIEKALQLYFGPPIDTTDRSLYNNSKINNYDNDGYNHNKGLEKDIFYKDPFITCRYCNHLNFIDVVIIRRMLALPLVVTKELGLQSEVLPPCEVCGRVDNFIIGSHDFSEEVEQRKQREEEEYRIKTNASTKIQRCYRRYLLKMYGSALSDAFLAEKFLKHTAALKINSVARGRLARRIRITKKHLVTIKSSHPLLIRHALRSRVGGPKVFWYKRQVELDMLYDNYLELVERTGFVPARLLVEQNIAEVAKRVIERKNLLIVLVQRRWRGFMARRMVQFFRTEIIRLFQSSVCRVMKIQAAYRGHRARLMIPTIIQQQKRDIILKNYNKNNEDKELLLQYNKLIEINKNYYIQERSEEKTLRYCSMIPTPSNYNNNKMEAYWDSQFSDNKLGIYCNNILYNQKLREDNKLTIITNENNRKQYIMDRISDVGPLWYGLRSIPLEEKPCDYYVEQFQVAIDNTINAEKERIENNKKLILSSNSNTVKSTLLPKYDNINKEASRCRAMRKYFELELKIMSEALLERIKHDFKSDRKLLQRFKAHNSKRLSVNNMREIDRSSSSNMLVVSSSNKGQLQPIDNNNNNTSKFKTKLKSSLINSNDVSNKKKIKKSVTIVTDNNDNNNSSSSNNDNGNSILLAIEDIQKNINNLSNEPIIIGDNNIDTTEIPCTTLWDIFGDEIAESTDWNADQVSKKSKKKKHSFTQQIDSVVDKVKTEPVVKGISRHIKGNYKYPDRIHFNAMEWLYKEHDDDDI